MICQVFLIFDPSLCFPLHQELLLDCRRRSIPLLLAIDSISSQVQCSRQAEPRQLLWLRCRKVSTASPIRRSAQLEALSLTGAI